MGMLFVVQFLSYIGLFVTPWTATHQSMQHFPVLHYLLEFEQTHVHWVGDAIQPPLLPLSPSPALNLPQHQVGSISQWVGSSHQVAKNIGASVSASVLPMNIQGWFPLELTGLISLLSKGLSRVFSSTTALSSMAAINHMWLFWALDMWLVSP